MLSTRIAGIVRDALGALARLGPRGLATGPVLVAIHRRVQLRLARFARLMARLSAGRIDAGRPAVVRRVQSTEVKRRAGARRASLVPRGWGWAVKMSRETAAFGSQLQALLAEPEVVEALRRVPEAGAILRPLCRMLAVDVPEVLRPAGWAPRPERIRRALRWRPPGDENWPGFKKHREKRERMARAFWAWRRAMRVRRRRRYYLLSP